MVFLLKRRATGPMPPRLSFSIEKLPLSRRSANQLIVASRWAGCRGNNPSMGRSSTVTRAEVEVRKESGQNFASSGEFVGSGERQRGVLVRNPWNLRQVESKDLC